MCQFLVGGPELFPSSVNNMAQIFGPCQSPWKGVDLRSATFDGWYNAAQYFNQERSKTGGI